MTSPAAKAEARPRMPWWVKLLLAYLAGITIIGKGPTYLGIPPLFWGEITMVLSILLIAPWVRGSGYLAKNRALTTAIVAFMLLGAVLTAIGFSKWKLDAVRDGAIWYYGLFYFVGMGLAAREAIADRVWWWLRVFWMVSLVWNTADMLSHGRISHAGVIIPWRGLPLFFNSVHEAGQNLALGAMIVLCTATLRRHKYWRAVMVAIALFGLGLFAAAQGRGMRLGMASGAFVVLLLCLSPNRRPHFNTRLLKLMVAAIPVIAMTTLIVPDKIVKITHLDRFEEADPADPLGTANWRAMWWEHLYDEVMRTNPAFGLGFGESLHVYHPLLYRLQQDFIVRSPHNINITVFSRMGIAGSLLWVCIVLGGIGGLFRRVWRGTAGGEPYAPDRRDELTFWIMMLVCTLVNSSLGVLMEGPVLGIWFWFALGFANARALTTGAPVSARVKLQRVLFRLRSLSAARAPMGRPPAESPARITG